jgi:hypothetical protein
VPFRTCLDCGRLFNRDATNTWRCPTHQAAADRKRNARGNTTARGYGAAHQRKREQLLAAFQPGQPCARCGQPIASADDADLGHDDSDRSQYRGLEHKRCNRATSGRSRRGNQSAARPPIATPAAASGADDWYFV